MCGRFSIVSSEELIKRIFRINRTFLREMGNRYNIAPTQDAGVVRMSAQDRQREWMEMRWGLVPSWSKSLSMGAKMINAKSETLFDKPAFRKAARLRRCLIPASGFYEWKQKGKKKLPFYFFMKNQHPFALAGLWELWKGGEEPLHSFTIITTEANELVKPVHPRMPVIIAEEQHEEWLDPSIQDPARIAPLMQPFSADDMTYHPVDSMVNNPRNNLPACIEPVPSEFDEGRLF